MSSVISLYQRCVRLVSGKLFEGLALLFTRFALAGVFWRSGRTKVEEGSWLDITDTTYFLFENEYNGVPLLPTSVSARSEEHTSELQSLMRISYAVFCLKQQKT